MRNRKTILLLILTLSFISLKSEAQETKVKNTSQKVNFSEIKKSKFPKSVGYVNDFEQIFTITQKFQLEKIISEYEKQTTNEIAIITIATIEPYDNMKDFATDISNEWGVGKKETKNGLTILFSKTLKEIRISTGNGTEKILTDKICKDIIDQTMIPEFKNGKYYNGIEKGLVELITKWN